MIPAPVSDLLPFGRMLYTCGTGSCERFEARWTDRPDACPVCRQDLIAVHDLAGKR